MSARLDLILIMSVNPGFGGQSFMESTLPKIEAVRKRIDASGRDIWLEFDAGVKADKAERICSAGAETLVAGSAISDGYAFTRIPWCPNPLLKLPVSNALKAVPLSTTHPVPHCVPICAPCAA